MKEPVHEWDEIDDPTQAPQHHLATGSPYTVGEGENAEVIFVEDSDPLNHVGDQAPDLNELTFPLRGK